MIGIIELRNKLNYPTPLTPPRGAEVWYAFSIDFVTSCLFNVDGVCYESGSQERCPFSFSPVNSRQPAANRYRAPARRSLATDGGFVRRAIVRSLGSDRHTGPGTGQRLNKYLTPDGTTEGCKSERV